MAAICNKQQENLPPSGLHGTDPWDSVYRENEKYVECGSAYFAQAFGEAMRLVSDIELHDTPRAGLRLASIATLVDHALRQYRTSLDIDSRTGLDEVHEARLKACGLDLDGAAQALRAARDAGHLSFSDELTSSFSREFSHGGYRGLMGHYLDKVEAILRMAAEAREAKRPAVDDGTQWQHLAWRLTAAFVDTTTFGQAIAVLNAAAYR